MPVDVPTQFSAADTPEELFLEGPVPDGEELLLRTVAEVRRRSARSARTRVALLTTAVLVACAALTGAGAILGRMLGGPASTAETSVTATDPRTGAHLAVALASADDGTTMDVTVTGLPVGTACQLTYVGKDGTRLTDGGGWRVPADGRPIRTHVWIPESDLAEIDVTTSVGAELVAHLS